jgi:(p)ppGpp synthase/HD superfamily hydrolase
MLEKALEIAMAAHKGQTDRGGQPYIFHPIRVMSSVKGYKEKVVALLHDVVEDSEYTLDDLNAHFTQDVVMAVDLLTKDGTVDYDLYIAEIAENPTARRVKLADMEDNMDISRLHGEITMDDHWRLEKYHKYHHILLQAER